MLHIFLWVERMSYINQSLLLDLKFLIFKIVFFFVQRNMITIVTLQIRLQIDTLAKVVYEDEDASMVLPHGFSTLTEHRASNLLLFSLPHSILP